MTTFFGSVWWMIVSIGILVTFHEFGHFWMARRFGVHVLRFSIGFGKPLFKRIGKDGTEYVIAAIPLGGYVKMLDEHEFEIDPADRHRALNRKPVLQRMAIAAAGPAANFLLCFVLFWAMFVVGQPDYLPIVGKAQGLAAQAGFLPGDRLTRIDGEAVGTWTDSDMVLTAAVMERKPVNVEVTRNDGGHAVRNLNLSMIPAGLATGEAMKLIGFMSQQSLAPPAIASIDATGPTNLLYPGDVILAIDGSPPKGVEDVPRLVGKLAKAGVPLHLLIQRGTQKIAIDVTPKLRASGKENPHLTIGITVAPPDYDGIRHYGPIAAVGASANEMRRQVSAYFGLVQRIFMHGETQDISSVVGIAQAANQSAQLGLASFLFFLGVLSLSLGILNLLPVPILDGGHLLYYLMELVKGSPVGERTLVVGQYIGLAMLSGLMCLAFYNDLLRPPS